MPDLGFREVKTLEVIFCEETPEVHKSPRGWGESEVHYSTVRSEGNEVEFKLKGKKYRIKKTALEAMANL